MALELVTFTGVESTIRTYLVPKLTGVQVATKVPNPRKPRMVRLQASGGSRRTRALSRRLLIVQCWDVSEPAAAELSERVAALLIAAQYDPTAPDIRGVQMVGEPTSFPDPGTALPRYQFTVSIDVRGHVTTA